KTRCTAEYTNTKIISNHTDAGKKNIYSELHQRLPAMQRSVAPATTGLFAWGSGLITVRPKMAGIIHSIHHRQGAQTRWVPASFVFLPGGVLRQPDLLSPSCGG